MTTPIPERLRELDFAVTCDDPRCNETPTHSAVFACRCNPLILCLDHARREVRNIAIVLAHVPLCCPDCEKPVSEIDVRAL